ncbi:MAG: phosphoribosylanthranilate isomerase [Verrucomicrobiae bacterium]|nr:phosphoribosylanthranilate isomerase [Verrucomicrobiae bacterium]
MSGSQTFFDAAEKIGAVKVKLCGFTDAGEAEQAIELGADALGFNFWPKSKRYLDPAIGREWLPDLAGKITRVGVFVNASESEILSLLEGGLIDAAQLHGDETPEFVASLIERGHRAFKALGVKDRSQLENAAAFPGDMLLLDAWAPVERGGTGEAMDWALGAEAVQRWPDRHIILAGGLKPENVADAIRQVRPFAVDVASGIEAGTPGRKDPTLMATFLEAAREIG